MRVGQDLFYTIEGANHGRSRRAWRSSPGVFSDEIRIFRNNFSHVHWIKKGEVGICRSSWVMVGKYSEEQLGEHSTVGTVLCIVLTILVPP